MRLMNTWFFWSYCMQKNNNLKKGRAIFGAFITVVVFFEAIFSIIVNTLYYFTQQGLNQKTDYKTAMIISISISVLVSAYYLIGSRYKRIISNYDETELEKNKENSFKALVIIGTTFGISMLSYFLIN